VTLTDDHLQTLLRPRAVRFYERAGSTNDLAREWLRAGAPDGAVVVADEQVAGRGRRGRAWQTPPGAALAVSLILRPPPDLLPRLSMLGALAAAELAEQTGARAVGIKWPNDVQIGGLKLAGVLPEAEWDGSHLLGAVLGIGVNVRIDFRGTELEGQAISLEWAAGARLDRAELVRDLLARVDGWYARLDSAALFEAWQRRLSMIGRIITVGEVQGVAESVDETGALLVRDAQGSLRRVIAGDLVMG
jgi:BirA family transcriptional regulator, biotin operon repressor / biotin---[acetyl-CoA-carboxylase] ligase